FSYNSRYRLAEHVVDQTYGDYLWKYTIGENYDGLGNITSAVVDETVSMATELDASQQYTYDEQNRLQSWTYNNGTSKQYDYDTCGNMTVHGDEAQEYTDLDHPHGVTLRDVVDESYSYDASGTAVAIGKPSGGTTNRYFKYVSSNRLVCQGTTAGACDMMQVIYDSSGKRIGTKYPGGQVT